MSLDFTVAIPVYNGVDRVQRVLDRLRSQINVEHLNWEILIIDNNSTDQLKEMISNTQANWTLKAPLRYVFEPTQGLPFARSCAVKTAQGKYIGFLDDDNLAHANWVASAYQFGEEHPTVGAYSGKIQAELTTSPPLGWDGVKSFLAIRAFGNRAKPFQPSKLQLPPGAGLVVRKQAWVNSVPQNVLIKDSRGGDDYQISLYMHNQGWEIWYNPEMVIDHHIPSWRIRTDYIASLAYLYGSRTCELQMMIVPWWQRPLIWMRGLMGAIKRLGLHLIQYGRLNLNSDMGTDIEMERDMDMEADRLPLQPSFSSTTRPPNMQIHCTRAFYWGNLMSPWLYLRNASQRFWAAYFA